MTIQLTPEVEAALAEEAHRQGTTPEVLAAACLREHFVLAVPAPAETQGEEGTLFDFLKGYIGTVSSSEYVPGGARLSEQCGERFTEGLLEKKRQGRL